MPHQGLDIGIRQHLLGRTDAEVHRLADDARHELPGRAVVHHHKGLRGGLHADKVPDGPAWLVDVLCGARAEAMRLAA